MPDAKPDRLLLIHGTNAYSPYDAPSEEEKARAARPKASNQGSPGAPGQRGDDEIHHRWWQLESNFIRHMEKMLGGKACCWVQDKTNDQSWKDFPWNTTPWWIRWRMALIAGGQKLLERWRKGRTESPPYQPYGRKLFVWSGTNSDCARRTAGKRLFKEGLVPLEEKGEGYHLVGHSHGGTVIWHALQEAVAQGKELEGLRSWTTLGTPFPVFKSTLPYWCLRFATVVTVSMLIYWFFGVLFTFPASQLDLGSVLRNQWLDLMQNGLSGTTWIVLALPALITLVCALALIKSLFHWMGFLREKARARRAWKTYGRLWLGIYSEFDEAIIGTHHTVGFYASNLLRWPYPGLPSLRLTGWLTPFGVVLFVLELLVLPFLFLIVVVFNWVIMPLAEWFMSFVFGARFHSADRFGTALAYISCEPCFHQNSRGYLGPQLAKAFHGFVERRVHKRLGVGYLEIRRRLAGLNDNQPFAQKLKDLTQGIDRYYSLIHDCYAEYPPIRRMIASHILARASGGKTGPTPVGRAAYRRRAFAGEVGQWLGPTPGDAEGTFPPKWGAPRDPQKPYRRPSRKMNQIPWPTAVLLAVLFGITFLFGLLGVIGDVEAVYIPALASQLSDVLQNEARARGDEVWGDRKKEILAQLNNLQPVSEKKINKMLLEEGAKKHLLLVLGELKSVHKETVQQLGKIFRNTSLHGPEVRDTAAKALIKINTGVAEEFGEALEHPDPHVRRHAVYALFQIPEAEADRVAAGLAKRVKYDSDFYVKRNAFYALCRLKDKAKQYLPDVLPGVLDDFEPFFAARGFLKHVQPQTGPLLDLLDPKVLKDQASKDRMAAALLVAQLCAGDQQLEATALEKLGKVVAETQNNDLAGTAAEALLVLPNGGEETLAKVLAEQKNPRVQLACMQRLVKNERLFQNEKLFKMGDSIFALVLAQRQPWLKRKAAETFADMGPKGAHAVEGLDQLMLIYLNREANGRDANPATPEEVPTPSLRGAAETALKAVGGKRVFELLRKELQGKNATTAYSVLHLVENVKGAPAAVAAELIALARDAGNRNSLKAVSLLRKLGQEDVKALARALKAQESEVTPELVVQVFPLQFGPSAEVTELVPVLMDGLCVGMDNKKPRLPEVRRLAALTLGLIGPGAKEAVASLQILVEGRDEKDQELRTQAALALGKIGSAANEAEPELREVAVNAKEPLDLRKAAISALGDVKATDPQTVQALLKIVSERQDFLLRVEAALALAKVVGAEPNAAGKISFQLADFNDDPLPIQLAVAWVLKAAKLSSGQDLDCLLDSSVREFERSQGDDVIWEVMKNIGKPSLPRLVKLLESNKVAISVKQKVAEVLCEISPEPQEVLFPLCQALESSDQQLIDNVRKVLKNLGKKGAAALIAHLHGAEEGKKELALLGLRGLGADAEEAVTELIQHLDYQGTKNKRIGEMAGQILLNFAQNYKGAFKSGAFSKFGEMYQALKDLKARDKVLSLVENILPGELEVVSKLLTDLTSNWQEVDYLSRRRLVEVFAKLVHPSLAIPMKKSPNAEALVRDLNQIIQSARLEDVQPAIRVLHAIHEKAFEVEPP